MFYIPILITIFITTTTTKKIQETTEPKYTDKKRGGIFGVAGKNIHESDGNGHIQSEFAHLQNDSKFKP